MGERSDDLRSRVYCSSCGASAPKRGGIPPLGWSEMPDVNDRKLALCAECVRRNLWLIEGRLDLDPGAGF